MENCISCLSDNRISVCSRLFRMNHFKWTSKEFYEENRFELISISVVLILYLANKCIFIPSLPESKSLLFFKCYFNDLLCPLLFLPACQIVLKCAGLNVQSYWLFLLLITVGGIIWEYWIPLISDKKTSDLIDLICYFVGMHLFYALMLCKKA